MITETGEPFNSNGIKTLWRHLDLCPAASDEVKLEAALGSATRNSRTEAERLEEGQKLLEGNINRLSSKLGPTTVQAVYAGSLFSLAEIERAQQIVSSFMAVEHARRLQISSARLNLQRVQDGWEAKAFSWEDDLEVDHLAAARENNKAASTCMFCSLGHLY